jgi:hypothetical protein
MRSPIIILNPEVDTGCEDDPMCFEPLALWKSNSPKLDFEHAHC